VCTPTENRCRERLYFPFFELYVSPRTAIMKVYICCLRLNCQKKPLQKNTRIVSFAPHLNNMNGSMATRVRRGASCLCSWHENNQHRSNACASHIGEEKRMSAPSGFLYFSLLQYRYAYLHTSLSALVTMHCLMSTLYVYLLINFLTFGSAHPALPLCAVSLPFLKSRSCLAYFIGFLLPVFSNH
jgi:hypothetical protein